MTVTFVLLLANPDSATARQEHDLRSDLAEARARWAAAKPTSYEFTIDVRCFCGGITKPAPTFRVIQGEPSSARELSSGSRSFYDHYNTIEKLFAAIDQSLSRGRYKSSVRFDATLGYPVTADLDPVRMVKDEELHFRVKDFRVIQAQGLASR